MRQKQELSNFDLRPRQFGKDFVWGVSTAAYQIEGAHNVDGKGISIWDQFVLKSGNIYNGHHGQTACEFYSRYEDDILLMKSMNIKHFRFSLSWTRILPQGTGIPNEKGIDFYNRVIDCCLTHGITPWVTLYHWDLPQALEEKGGWSNREILGWFETYVTLCARCFGTRVKNWMVLNEPMVFTGAGYFLGVHAPGRKGLKNFLPAVHHAVLCQALGGRILRSTVKDAHIGTTFSCSQITPHSQTRRNIKAAERVDALLNRLFIEPSLGLGYPTKSLPLARRIEKYQTADDIDKSPFDFDFVGIQNYTREVVKHSYTVPYIQAKIVKATKRKVKTTVMDWEVYPPSIDAMIRKFDAYENVRKIIVTENGAAFEDFIKKGNIQDNTREAYLKSYVRQVHAAKNKGAKVSGYFVWTFTDNFEWAEGYYPKFGLVHVDFNSQKRTIKKSGKWFAKFIASDVDYAEIKKPMSPSVKLKSS